MIFEDRQEAGKRLARELDRYKTENPIVFALPRGGVPIGFQIAKELFAPLDIIVVRKLGAPGREEFGIGAIAEGGVLILDHRTIQLLDISDQELDKIISREQKELERRVKIYRHGRPITKLNDRAVILVDDGLATGVTGRAAIQAVRNLNPKKLIFALPVCAMDTVEEMRSSVDELVCIATPIDLVSVGNWYQNFAQVTDDQVHELLTQTKKIPK